MSPSFNGIRLNNVVKELMDSMSFESDKDVFLAKLKQAGYSYNEVYDNYVYNFIKEETYCVCDDFPRIRKSELPTGVSKVKYEIELSQIEKFKE